MAVKIRINVVGNWNGRRYGRPWIAVYKNGKYNWGNYDAINRVLVVDAEPGDIIVFGQKDYRRPDRSLKAKFVAPAGDYEVALAVWGATNGTVRDQVAALPQGEIINY
ncbi:MAG: hypothetical protein J7L56_03440 [Halomonas sp.]|nr:hypothetical protein [Halomonas sp.]MCD6437305.1 hypothetical protein [Halomonas sp.]